MRRDKPVRYPFEIRDPLRERVRTTLNRWLVCSWKGHARPQKMYGVGACRRCE